MNYAEKYLTGNRVIDLCINIAVEQAVRSARDKFHNGLVNMGLGHVRHGGTAKVEAGTVVKGTLVETRACDGEVRPRGNELFTSVISNDQVIKVLQEECKLKAAQTAANNVTTMFNRMASFDDVKLTRIFYAVDDIMVEENKAAEAAMPSEEESLENLIWNIMQRVNEKHHK